MSRHAVMVAGAAAFILGCWPGFALAGKPVLECRHKAFPNLPGANSLTLVGVGPKAYKLTVQAYDKPQTFRVKCSFHEDDRGTFYCAKGQRRGFFNNRTKELSVGVDGEPKVFEGYTFHAVKSPLGASRRFIELRFPAASCKLGER